MKKLIIPVILIISIAITGCTTPSDNASQTASQTTPMAQTYASSTPSVNTAAQPSQSAIPSASTEQGTEIIDQNNMKVVVPSEINRFVTTALPLPSIYALTGAPINKIVGMHPGSTGAIENSVMAAMYPELLKVPSDFIKGKDINLEELLKLNPDVVMYWAEYMNQYEVMNNAGIKAVGVKTQDNGDVISTLESWLVIMEKMFHTKGNTDKVITYAREVQTDIAEKTKTIPDSEKPRTLMLKGHSAKEITVSGKGDYGNFWVESTGGKNAADGINAVVAVNMEQIYTWNPDIIVISTFSDSMPEDFYNNTIEGQDWSKVNAIKNKRVYKEPLGVYRWYPPSGDAPLMLQWMAETQNPDLFDYDMKKEVVDYYKQFYSYDLTNEQVEGILASNPEAAKGASWAGKK